MIVVLPRAMSGTRPARSSRRRRLRHGMFSPRAERLEGRALLATFPVTTLLDGGAGSLRDAIVQANANPGADDITSRSPARSTCGRRCPPSSIP